MKPLREASAGLSPAQIATYHELENVAALLRATKSLEVKVQIFLNEMESDRPGSGKTALTDHSEEFIRFIQSNRERYEDQYQAEADKAS